LRIKHINLALAFQLILVLGSTLFVLSLCIEGFACLVGFFLDTLSTQLLRICIHFGSLRRCFMLLRSLLCLDQLDCCGCVPTVI
jgi:hypothetical protein